MTFRNLSLSASIFGLAIVTAFPFLDYQPVSLLLERLGRYSGLARPVAATLVACAIGFGIRRHSLSFYQIRGFGWRDLGAALFLMVTLFASVILINSLISALAPPAAPAAGGDTDGSSAPGIPSGYAGAIKAGICEEFLYPRWCPAGYDIPPSVSTRMQVRTLGADGFVDVWGALEPT